MTATLEPTDIVDTAADSLAPAPLPPSAPDIPIDDQPTTLAEEVGPIFRPLLVATLTSTAAALMTGGIFGSWGARLVATGAVLIGVFWAWLVLRARGQRVLLELALMPVTMAVAFVSVLVTSSSESPFALIGKAVRSGRLLRPPVPFDPGWRPVLIILFVIIGFSAAWVATALRKPQGGLLLPLSVLALTAISQPAEGEFIAALVGGIPVLAAIAVLFGGDAGGAAQLGRQFEIKRLIRGVIVLVPIGGLLVALNSSNFLFPKPAYNPAQKPQKPKAVPLSEARDRVLFEVDGPITGPWLIGALDVYDGKTWRLPPFDPKRLKAVPGDGIIDKDHQTALQQIKFTTRDLGDSSVFPGVATPAVVSFPGQSVFVDPRLDTFRVKSGRIPANYAYTMSLPAYPTATQLSAANPEIPANMREYLDIPKPAPPAVQELLNQAPQNPWQRLDFVRSKLNKVVVATGAGVPGDVPPSKVQDLLVGKHEGTPFEIVAAEAMLARWAGVPSRIGFGFDAGQKEGNVTTIRPKNAAQFLEVWFKGYGWVPVIGAPPKAKTALDTDKNKQFNPTIQPSDDVAVELYIPVELENLRQLYQRVRDVIINGAPFAIALLLIYLAMPYLLKTRRRSKRRRWAAGKDRASQIAVEYAELRDLATDLSVGDPFDTPLEYRQRVVEDDEHEELVWLVTRVLYGDMRHTVTDEDVAAARELSESLQQRMFRAQPLQTRVLGVLSRASLAEPYTDEVPNVRLPRLPRRKKKVDVRRKRRRPPTRPLDRIRIRRVLPKRKASVGGGGR